jgi:hypothetical protein
VIIVLLLTAVLSAQEPPHPLARILELSSSKDLLTPAFMRSGPPSCDTAGNLYTHVSSYDQPFNNPEVVKISTSNGDPTRFRLSDDTDAVFATFFVSPEGDVAMAVEKPNGIYVFSFDSKGKPGNGTKLDIPSPFFKPKQLGVFSDGSIFMAGYYGEGSPEKLAGKGLSAIFEPSGKLRKELTRVAMKVDLSKASEGPLEGALAMGTDYNLYFLQPEKIVVISSSGEIVRTIRFKKPDPRMIGRNIAVRDGFISLEFARTEENSPKLVAKYMLLSSDSGEPRQVFDVSKQLPNTAVCFNASDGYTFVRFVSGHLRLEFASVR